ncbi:hypothetical protein, variant 2 [Aphanomyces invadans]|uniref:VPS9 domain-containing protein n=1 Tax=Aphanomyces invadans TaxID=157072 RepID=A0A024UDN1_9STRA|nr:hypothetical protein, variant 2 [Aphanomyces invadans]ETW04506.1 hypothetical protein, variant 2 [Aphanomyces invadans]|eukprot:XP_008867462.1 hypothetical protein, variant 2 [Aphanomyces invadans]
MSTNPFMVAVELHFPQLLQQVRELTRHNGDAPSSTIKFLVCVPQSLSLLTGMVTIADVATHVLVADATVGMYQTLDGRRVAIVGSSIVTKEGFDGVPARSVRIVMTDTFAHASIGPPDSYQCLLLHINRPFVGGVAVPEDMGEMDCATFRRYLAMIRAYPESAAVFSSLDVFVHDVFEPTTSASKKRPQHYLTPRRLRHVWTKCVDLLDDTGTLDTPLLAPTHVQHRHLQLAQAVESYLMEQVHDVVFAAVVFRCRKQDDAVRHTWRLLEHATPRDFNIAREFQCEQRQAIDLIANTHVECHSPLAMLMQLKRALTALNDAISRHLVRHRTNTPRDASIAQYLSTDDVLDQLLFVLVQVSKQCPAFPLAAIVTYIQEYHFVNSSVSALGFALANFQVALEWFTSHSDDDVPPPRPVVVEPVPPLAAVTTSLATAATCTTLRVMGSAPFAGQIIRDTVRNISCGPRWFAIVSDAGDVSTWGDASGGRLGVTLLTTTRLDVPTAIPQLQHVVQVSCGGWHVLACDLNGHVYSWGSNVNGQLGLECPNVSMVPTPTLVEDLVGTYISAVASGDGHSLALTSSGQVYSWGSNRFDQLGRDLQQGWTFQVGRVDHDWGGRNLRFERRCGTACSDMVDQVAPGAAMRIAAGSFHSAVITRDGALFMWGCGHSGQLGLGSFMDASVPTQVLQLAHDEVSVAHVGCGAKYSCVLLASGHALIAGQLVDHDRVVLSSTWFVKVPTPDDVDDAAFASHFVSISCGPAHCAFVNVRGNVLMWGTNAQGQILPQDGTVDVVHPPRWLASRVAHVTCGESHTMLAIVE